MYRQWFLILLFLPSVVHAHGSQPIRRTISDMATAIPCDSLRDGLEFVALDPVDNSDCTTGGGTAVPHDCICDGTTSTYKINPGNIIGTFTQGSVPFANSSGSLIEDNASFFWDDANDRLGIGTTSPDSTLHVIGGLCVEAADTACAASPGVIDAEDFTENGSTQLSNNISGLAASATSLAVNGANCVTANDAAQGVSAAGEAEGCFPALRSDGDTSTGDITIQKADPALILDPATATDTEFWIGITEDAGSDDDDLFQIGDGTTPGTNPFLTINTDGWLGINATPPTYGITFGGTSNPNGIFYFSGTAGGGGEGFSYKDSTNNPRYFLNLPGSDVVAVSNRASNGVVQIRANTATAGAGGEVVAVVVEDDEVQLLPSGGNVGISIAAPDGTLHVHSGSAGTVAPDANYDDLTVENSGNAGITLLSPDGYNSFVVFGSPTDNIGSVIRHSYNTSTLSIGTQLTGGIVDFYSGNFSGPRMTIDAVGEIGIGTTSPDSTLHVIGGLCVETSDSGCATAANTLNVGNGAGQALAYIYGADNSQNGISVGASATRRWTLFRNNDANNNNFNIYEDNTAEAGGSSGYRMTVKQGGYVGINTTDPDSTLHVIGGICAETSDSGCAAAAGVIDAEDFTEDGTSTLSNDISGLAGTATALAANGANCATANDAAQGVDASGAAEGCFPALRSDGDTATGNYTFDTNTLHIDASGDEVGIGTTGPEAKLHVQTAVDVSTAKLRMSKNDGGSADAVYILDDRGWSGANTGDTLRVTAWKSGGDDTGALLKVESYTGATVPRLIVENESGNVGIGTGDPATLVEVSGTAAAGSVVLLDSSATNVSPAIQAVGQRNDGNTTEGFAGKLQLTGWRSDAAVGNTKTLGSVAFGGNHTDGTYANILYAASITGVAEGTFNSSSDMPTGIRFATGAAGVTGFTAVQTGTERMRIAADGDVGIGTSGPATNLHVSESNTDTTPTVEVEQLSTGDAALQFSIAGDAYALGIDNSDSDKFKISYAAGAGTAVLGTGDVLTIDTAGQVGIGTASPPAPLSVAGNPGTVAAMTTGHAIDGGGFGSYMTSATREDGYVWFAGTDITNGGAVGTDYQIGDLVIESRAAITDASLTEYLRLTASGKLGLGGITPATNLHVSENNADTTPTVEVEQLSTGDAALQFSIAGDAYAMGIDNSDSDAFKISYAAGAGTAVLGSGDRFRLASDGDIEIGNVDLGARVTIYKTTSATSGTEKNLYARYDSVNTSASTANIIAIEGRALHNNAATAGIDRLTAIYGVAQNQHTTQTVADARGLLVDMANSGTITDTYGVYVGDVTVGTQTNTPYSFYAWDAGAYNYFAGDVGIGTAAPDGTLHVHTATAGSVTANTGADELVVEHNAHGGISILTPDASIGRIYWGTPSDNAAAIAQWVYSTTTMQLGTSVAGGIVELYSGADALAITIDGNQEVGIQTSTPDSALQVGDPDDATTDYVQIDTEDGTDIASADCNAATEEGRVIWERDDEWLKVCTGSTNGWEDVVHAVTGNMYEDDIGGSTTDITVSSAGTYYGWKTATAGPLSGGMVADAADATADHLTVPLGGVYEVGFTISWNASGGTIFTCCVHETGTRTRICARDTGHSGGGLQSLAATGHLLSAASAEYSLRCTSNFSTDSMKIESANLNARRIAHD